MSHQTNDRAWGNKQNNDKADEQARNRVFLEGRAQTVLIKINTKCDLGLQEKVRDEARIVEQQAAQAEKQGVEFHAYRARGDSGKQLIENAASVSLRELLCQLAESGYTYNGGHRFTKQGKNVPTQVLEFVLTNPKDNVEKMDDDAIDAALDNMSASIELFLCNGFFSGVYVYANRTENGRLDTINCFEVEGTKKSPAQRLVIAGAKGGTYRLEPNAQ